jgi:hypothetical protein
MNLLDLIISPAYAAEGINADPSALSQFTVPTIPPLVTISSPAFNAPNNALWAFARFCYFRLCWELILFQFLFV